MNHSDAKSSASPGAPRPGRARRALAVIAKAAGLGVVFSLAAAGGAILHMGMGAPRRFAALGVSSILAGSFQGKIVIHRLGTLRLDRIEDLDAEVLDPEGKRAALVYGARVKLAPIPLVRSLLGHGPVVVRVPEIQIAGAEVALEENAAGELGLARAFAPRTPSPSDQASSGADVSIPRITLGHAWVHGHMAAVPILDADLDRVGASFALTPETMRIGIDRLRVLGRGMPGMDPEGDVVASADLPSDPKGPRKVHAHYAGRVGRIPVVADGALDGDDVTADADVAEADPEAIAALAPGKIQLGAKIRAHASVRGHLPDLSPALEVHIGDGGEIKATGQVKLPEEPKNEMTASAKLDARDIDVSALQAGAPASKLTAHVEASVISRPGGDLTGTFSVESQPGEVSGQVVPAVSARGDLTPRSVRGTARIDERGAPTTLRFDLHPHQGGDSPDELTFDVDSTVPDLRRVERIGPIGRGRVHIRAEGGLDLPSMRLDARASGDAQGLAVSGVSLSRASFTGRATGPVSSLQFQAGVDAAGISAGGLAFRDLHATAGGSPAEIDVGANLDGAEDAPDLKVHAHLSNGEALVVRGARVDATHKDVTAVATVASVRVAGGAVDVRGARIEGLGDPLEAEARIFPGGLRVKAATQDLDLGRVARLLGSEADARGHVMLDVDAAARGRKLEGRLDVQGIELATGSVEGASASLSTSIDGDHVRAEIHADLGKVGAIKLSAPDVRLGGSAMDPAAWQRARGEVAIDGSVDLAKLLEQVPADARPVRAAGGTIALHGKAVRASAKGLPSLDLTATTAHLGLTGNPSIVRAADGSEVVDAIPWRTAGIDGAFGVKIDGTENRAEISAEVHDQRGALASIAASVTTPLTEISRAVDRWMDLPVHVSVDVPRRSLDALPPALGTMPATGEVSLHADLDGALRAPTLDLEARGYSVLPRGAATCVKPIDLDAHVTYDGQRANARVAASRDGREAMVANASARLSAAQALGGGALDWDASGDVTLDRFPLDVVGAAAAQPIAGEANGKVTLTDLHRDARLEASVDLRDLTLDRAAIPHGQVRATLKDGSLSATARLDQTDGFIETNAQGVMRWGAEVAPSLDLAKTVEVGLKAKNFRANAAFPFVQGLLSELDGRVDADAKLRIEKGGADGSVDGAVTIRDGIFEVPQIGERFHDLQGRIIMKPWGTLRFQDFSAKAPTGSLSASAEATLKGLALSRADARIHIASGESIPLTFEGVPMGRAFGDVTAKARMSADAKRLDVAVNIPTLHVDLPQSIGHSVQPLERDKTVRVGLHAGKDFIALPLTRPEKPAAPSDMVVHATVKLGPDIQVRRDTTVNVVAEGATEIDVRDQTRVTGQIRLTRGQLELQGKQFTIDRGIVSFVGGDPADPLIIATAYWNAPDGTRVYADFSGHVSSGKLALRSEPALSQDEILALLLFGSPDGSFGAGAPPGREESTGVKAAGLVGGTVTEGLNKALSGMISPNVTTRVDTSESSNPRPELAVQISKSVSARVGYKLGVPPPGENPDRTELTLDWRFYRNWSLSTTVGDQGSTALDMVWRLRY